MGSTMTVCCGIGINLVNEKPLASIATLTGKRLSREELMAGFFSRLEKLTGQLSTGIWRKEYYRLWCSSIGMKINTYNGAGELAGLDRDGFLLLRKESDIERFDTDNNSFDLMQGLISRK